MQVQQPWRDFLNQPLERKLGAAAFVVVVAVGVWSVWRFFASTPAVAASTRGQFVCAQTGKPFELTISPGITIPVHSPYSDSKTGYPAEFCYWTADGQIRSKPVHVLLNSYIGKREPTFCPDCDRLVRARNPQPVPGFPPPTRDQYQGNEDE
jgi:hypothetical protein